MNAIVGAPRPLSLFGVVSDQRTGIAIAGAAVQLASWPAPFQPYLNASREQLGAAWSGAAERPDRTRSDFNGEYRFVNLPAGGYTLTVTVPGSASRWGVGTFTAAVGAPASSPTIANLGLTATAVAGVVTGQAGSESAPVALAWIRFDHTDESTYSDSDGNYVLNAVEAGARTLVVYSSAFPLKSVAATLVQGQATTVNVVLGT